MRSLRNNLTKGRLSYDLDFGGLRVGIGNTLRSFEWSGTSLGKGFGVVAKRGYEVE